MLLDFSSLPDGHAIGAEICIIGAGAAGITLALELARTGIDVLLLEAGGVNYESSTQSLYEGEVVDARMHSPPDKYRQRRLGGTTTIWGGRCVPFDSIDFETRDYVPHSGWPVTHAEILPYYPAANRLCEAGQFAYTVAAAEDVRFRPLIKDFEGTHFTTDHLERFSCPTNFGARYHHKLRDADTVRLLLHANVTHLQLNEAGTAVVGATLRSLTGTTGSATAKRFILAVGGLESARLLLASRDIQAAGIGNEYDAVGRYYMCHVAGTIGAIRFNLPLSSVWYGYEISDDGVYCRRRFALRAATQRQLGLGNFVARLHHPRIADPSHQSAILSLLYLAKPLIAYEYAMRLTDTRPANLAVWAHHLANVAHGPFDAVRFAWHMLRDRKLAGRKFPSIILRPKVNLFSLDFHAEQQPNPSSRVKLAHSLDQLGVQRLEIDWRYTPGDVETVRRAISLLATDIREFGKGSFEYDEESIETEMTRYGAYGGHHIGTARMGNDPRSSVVNGDCRVHGVENLYVVGSAVFPTSSQANPTLTIVAFALRLAEHLKKSAD